MICVASTAATVTQMTNGLTLVEFCFFTTVLVVIHLIGVGTPQEFEKVILWRKPGGWSRYPLCSELDLQLQS